MHGKKRKRHVLSKFKTIQFYFIFVLNCIKLQVHICSLLQVLKVFENKIISIFLNSDEQNEIFTIIIPSYPHIIIPSSHHIIVALFFKYSKYT